MKVKLKENESEEKEKEKEGITEQILEEILTKIKYKCVNSYPFYGIISYSVGHKFENLPYPFATDGKNIYIAKNWDLRLWNFNDLLFSYLHELKHILFFHNFIQRAYSLNPTIWNMATDLVINELTKDEVKPTETFFEKIITKDKFEEFKDKDVISLGSIEIYNILAKKYKKIVEEAEREAEKELKNKKQRESKEEEEGSSGEEGKQRERSSKETQKKEQNKGIDEKEEIFRKKIDERKDLKDFEKEAIKEAHYRQRRIIETIKSMTPSEIKDFVKNIEKNVFKAYAEVKNRGELTASVENLIQHAFKQVRDWREVLEEEFKEELNKGDWTWAKRSDILESLNYAGYNNIAQLPTLDTFYSIPKVIIGIDTSGSISDKEYKHFLDEVYSLFSTVNVDNYEIALWEGDVVKVLNGRETYFETLKRLQKRVGYGGTVLKSLLGKYKNENNAILIILTDGEFEEDLTPYDFSNFKKVIFVITKNGTTKFIPKARNVKVIRMEEDVGDENE
jgi:predicted metal-dependent peptidase